MAAGSRRVTVEFVGKDKLGAAAKKVSGEVDGIGTSARRSDSSINRLGTNVSDLKDRLQALNRTSSDPDVDVDITAAVTKLDDIKARLEFLRAQPATAQVRADIADAQLNFEAVKRSMADIDGRVLNVDVDVDTGQGGGFGRLAKEMAGVGLSMTGLVSKSSLVVGALGAVVLTAGKLTQMALGAGPALGAIALGAGAVGLALSNLKLTKAGKEFAKFKKQLKEVKRELQSTAQRNILPGLTRGLQGLAKLAGPFKAAWGSVTRSVGRELGKLGENLGKNQAIKKFLDNIRAQAPGTFASLRRSIENVVTSVVNLLNAFTGGKGGKSLTKTIEDITDKMKGFTENPEKMDHLVQNVNDLATAFDDVWEKSSKVYSVLSKPVPAPKEPPLPKIGKRFAQDFKNIPNVARRTWEQVKNATSRAWGRITASVSRGAGRVRNAVSRGWGAVRGATARAWGAVRGATARAWGGISSTVSRAWGRIRGAASRGAAAVRGVVSRAWGAIRGAASRAWGAITSTVSRAWGRIRGAASRGAAAVRGVASRAWAAIRGAASRAWSAIVSAISRAWGRAVSATSSGANRVVSFARSLPGRIRSALGNLGGLLVSAGRSLMSGLTAGISSGAGGVFAKVRSVASGIASTAMAALGIHSPSRVMSKIGRQIMDGLIQGFHHRWVPLTKVVKRLTGYIKRHTERLKDLQKARKGVMSDFRSMPSSVFNQDLTHTWTSANGAERTKPGTSKDMVRYQRRVASRAKRLARDIRKLRKAGISDALLRQMVSAGESGWDNIHALAAGPVGDVRALNRAQRETSAALTRAGRGVGEDLYRGRIREQQRDVRTARHIERALDRWAKHQKKHTVIELRIDGRVIRSSLIRLKRRNGGKRLGLT